MGFNPFKKARKFVSKIIPNEVKPFLPYLMAAMPGGMGLSAGLQKFGGDAFLKAALTKGITDDEADLKDSLRTGIIAAAPTAIGEGLNVAGNSLINDATLGNKAGTGKLEFAQALKNAGNSNLLNPEGIMANAKMIGAQGATDFGIQQAEIAEEELEEYNRMLKEQGVGDSKARRSAIYDIFMSAGYDGDYVNEMLDGYGYADGGRIGLYQGGSSNVEPDFISMREVVENVNNDQMKEGIMKMAYEPGVPTTGDLYDMNNPDYKGINPSVVKEFIEEGIPLGYNSPEEYYEDFYGIMGMKKGGRAGYRYGKSVNMARGKGKQKAPKSTTGITGINIKAEVGDDEEAMTMADFIEAMKGDDGFDPENLNSMREGLEMFYGTPMMGNTEPVPMMRFNEGGVVDVAKAKKAIAKAKKNKKPKKNKDKKYKFFDLVDKEAQDKKDAKREAELDIKYNAQAYPPSMRGNYANGGLMGLKMGGRPMEMDYRQGGFIPVGSKERADDVPARLSKNEFVMTADAVRAAGGGSVNKGAKRMYNLMNNLEAK